MGLTTIKTKFQKPPRTAMEVFEMLPEGTLAEVINNVLYIFPAPSFEHQDLLGDLFTDIKIHFRNFGLGKCVFSPLDWEIKMLCSPYCFYKFRQSWDY